MLLASAHDVIALVAQCQLVLPSHFVFEDVTHAKGHARFGTPGFEDEAFTVRRVQDNAALFAVQPALIIVFGHSVGAWPSCVFACISKDGGTLVGFITQFGFCGDLHGIQCQRQSYIIVWSLQLACGGNGLYFVRCIQP